MTVVAGVLFLALALGSVIDGPNLWNAAYAFMLAFGIRDWRAWRSDPELTPREVADRFMAHLLIFAIGVAMPAISMVEEWIGN